ncbi:hypothetical protein C474_13974 [Halogeometricum pallidum JCM 14848]|uniref:Uncharacterized protein n=1 Tax=Halogeometricum pallidum JCM 14848 TaxID=1227487 RepID=M0D0R4_HALPD|nr:hypothetical protein [Halogeometricum pallidum]ELZ29015.1 hypothetical protein C474_13974 [Halogeometricum pallidum JCM 14848]
MRDDKVRMEICDAKDLIYDKTGGWALFDSESYRSFFPDRCRDFYGVPSDDGQYIACWAEDGREYSSGYEPAGICLVNSHKVVQVIEVTGISEAVPGNDGTIAALGDRGDTFYLFDSSGTQLLKESFESNTAALAISPDGQYAAVATAFPDNAVHIYKTKNGRYLGRTENVSTSVLGHLQFTSRGDKRIVETYNIGPDSTLDVDPRRKEVLDKIPVEAQLDAMQLEGIAIVPDSSIGEWHFIPDEVLEEVDGALRIPGVELVMGCGEKVEPLTADLIIDDPQNAVKGEYEFCEECKSSSAAYPVTKVERTR